MAKFAVDAVIDGTLDVYAAATRLFICSAQPANYTEASSTYALADVTIDSGDFTKANGDTSGRKVTVGAQSSVLIDASGTATHVVLGIAGSSTLLGGTTCTSQALTANGSNTVNIPAWDIEVADPA